MRMKTSSGGQPLSRSAARNCLLVNQFGTPGLGSIMAGRWLAGLVELALAVAGFCAVIGWFFQLFSDAYRNFSDAPPQTHRYGWLGWVGGLLFLAAWLLSWITSLRLLAEARRNEANAPPPAVPPVIK